MADFMRQISCTADFMRRNSCVAKFMHGEIHAWRNSCVAKFMCGEIHARQISCSEIHAAEFMHGENHAAKFMHWDMDPTEIEFALQKTSQTLTRMGRKRRHIIQFITQSCLSSICGGILEIAGFLYTAVSDYSGGETLVLTMFLLSSCVHVFGPVVYAIRVIITITKSKA